MIFGKMILNWFSLIFIIQLNFHKRFKSLESIFNETEIQQGFKFSRQ